MSLLQKVNSGMGSTDCHMSMFDLYYKNSCGCTALEVPRGTTEQTDWRVKQQPQVACVSEDLKCWGAWCTTCWHKVKDITLSIAWRTAAWTEETPDLPWKDERGPSLIRRTWNCFKGSFGETSERRGGLFRVQRYYLQLNWVPNWRRPWMLRSR